MNVPDAMRPTLGMRGADLLSIVVNPSPCADVIAVVYDTTGALTRVRIDQVIIVLST